MPVGVIEIITMHDSEVVLSYYVANVDNLAEIQELTYRDWSNDMSGSNCSVQWSDSC